MLTRFNIVASPFFFFLLPMTRASAAAAAAAVLCCAVLCCTVSCSGLLVRHARRVLGVAAEVLNKPGRPRIMKACKEVGGSNLIDSFCSFGCQGCLGEGGVLRC
jgi:hypothetical protein